MLNEVDLKNIASAIGLRLETYGIWFSLDELFDLDVKVLDQLFGPCSFYYRMVKRNVRLANRRDT